MMQKRLLGLISGVSLGFGLISTAVANTQLAVPKSLIALDSEQGKQIFMQTNPKHLADYWLLSSYFTTEKGLAYCAPASIVMVLNALDKTPDVAPEHSPYKIYNQSNLFYNQTILKKGITPARINGHGMTLDQAAFVLKQYAGDVETHYGSDIKNIDAFRNILLKAIEHKRQYVLINFARTGIDEVGGGHFSPLAAYNQKTDRWLMLDVARYKYPSVWIETKALYQAIQGVDSSSHKSRGVIIVS
ncbi:MAG: phytochelatin synthase family protein [Francisellaceae bacterium]